MVELHQKWEIHELVESLVHHISGSVVAWEQVTEPTSETSLSREKCWLCGSKLRVIFESDFTIVFLPRTFPGHTIRHYWVWFVYRLTYHCGLRERVYSTAYTRPQPRQTPQSPAWENLRCLQRACCVGSRQGGWKARVRGLQCFAEASQSKWTQQFQRGKRPLCVKHRGDLKQKGLSGGKN